ncbi:hypothetical protein NDI43_08405 [Microcoleus vaginatus GB2-A3]|uniref:hypothetical protein n=1 Tax=Microcoleus vaginatus TaxID=119532 RepID=UPI0032AAA965
MELAHKDLLQQIARLSETYANLADRLSQAAKQLQDSGLPPSDSLLQEVAAYSRNFAAVQKQALELNKSAIAPGEIASLKDIQNLVQTAAASEGKAEIRDAALKVIDRVLAIAHREQSDFAPLQSVHARARELQRAISESTPTQLHSDAESLVSGKHPVSAVLALVEQQDKLDDEQWVILEETVSAAFGKQIAVAISRGKLTIAEMVKAAPAKVEPAFKAAPEQKISAEPLPEVIVIPSGNVAPKQVTVAPQIQILESPAPSAPMHEVIIVPSVEVPKSLPTTGSGNIVFGAPRNIQPAVAVEGGLGIKVLVHIQGIGDRTFGAQEYAGTKAQGRRVEGFAINIDPPIPGLNVEYMAHVEGVGDTPWLSEGELAGFRGQAKRIEGFAVRLSGPQADKYDVFYSAHIQNIGDTDVSSNGEYCGTRGKALRIEGIKVWIAQSASSQTVAPVGLKVLAHIQGIGDRTFSDREYAGTKAQGRRVEGFQIKIEPPVAGLNLQYMAHVEGVGDTAWISEGELAGFRGKAKRIEGFAARLTGPQADKYDVFYTAHIQNVGDTPVTANGQYCGTRGKGLRVEGMTVWVEPKA